MTKQEANGTAAQETPRRVVMVTYPDAHILDIAGPIEVLSGAALFLPEGTAPYAMELVAQQAGPVLTTSGISLQADRAFNDARQDTRAMDTLIISGGHGTSAALTDPALMDFIAWAVPRARRVVSICTGAMILAELGMLDGRRATTHWWWCPILSRKYPAVHVEPDSIFVRDGPFWTSAGVTSGMDLALALLEEDWGHDIALQVARYNVMYVMRPGGQTQFSANLLAQKAEDPAIGKTLEYILSNLGQPLTVTALAARACMSERSFARKFREETGVTPAHYVEAARLQAVRVALEQTGDSIDQIARRTGFQNAERMRRAFHRQIGVSANDYRARFRFSPAEGDQEPPD
ncbi:transcriptional regulator GlxA family with amidase domain [Altererythrobacter atlanticus]|uniref:HTH-type transcriptional regulator CdhR n=1 Tax=Croceibacterium atlanticum TaxID=1267766 RepID=A0A0F7KXH5_9SPHN|nr:GlxA family transcriptional regulator [Croceibacterium atlanticum]AKH43921.1 HTH-type transcriptional regulator CdhR [Croceibacterium atlanticum]MBB5733629.1 transcriptional regulator GlxA family with amidase domain [Croceibacterium atlanticum]